MNDKPRRWSFGLRTMFVALTLLAITVGLVARERRESNRQMAIVASLGSRVDKVIYCGPFHQYETGVSQPTAWNEILSLLLGQRVFGLQLSRTTPTDLTAIVGLKELHVLEISHSELDDLTPLAEMGQLRQLILFGLPIRDLTPLAGLSRLEVLSAQDTQVEDLSPLAGLGDLLFLNLEGTQVTDLAPLANASKLFTLLLANTRIDKEQIVALQQRLPNCRIALQKLVLIY